MPLTQGRYAPTTFNTRRDRLAFRWRWLRGNILGFLSNPPWKHHPDDHRDAHGLYREWGFWMIRPDRGWRSLRWISPPIHATRHIPATDNDAACDWAIEAMGLLEHDPGSPRRR